MKKILIIAALLLLTLPALGQYVAQDPTRYIPNARVLGLGKAFIGLANDTGAIYTNPAGLADAENWQLTSMSGKFLDEYNYLSFSGFYPTEYGVLGLGFAGTSISGAWATTIESGSDPSDPLYTIDPNQTQMGNYNNAFILSYANQLTQVGFLRNLPQAERFTFGTNAKIFRTALYGDGIVGGDGSGFDLDLAAKYHPPQPWMSFGACAKNVLPFGLGGKLKYASGHEESYPMVFEVGSVFKILGKSETSLLSFQDQELQLLADFDYYPTLHSYPIVGHFGLEWLPVQMVALRAGIDQDTSGNGLGGLTTISDLAFGVGLNFAGFRFDYAYHTFAGAPNIDNHYFSLSYGLLAKAKAPEAFILDAPADRSATFESKVAVSGRLLNPDIRALTLNGAPVKFSLRGLFSTTADMKLGKNRLVLECKNVRGEKIAVKKISVARLYTFSDVPSGYWAAQPISLLAMAEITGGYPDGSFKPEGNISRAEMCALLMKSKGPETKPKTSEKLFNDVPAGNWAEKYINAAVDAGVAKGYAGNLFKPTGKITRAEGLAMIVRFAGITEEVYANQFKDVFGRHWIAPIIAGAHKAGVLQYLKGKDDFEPNRLLTRAEAIELLYRTPYMQGILEKDWQDFEKEEQS